MRLANVLLIAVIIASCDRKLNNNEGELSNSLSILDKERVVYYNTDSIEIHPYEHFNIVEFETLEAGAFEDPYVKLNIIDSIQKVKIDGAGVIYVKAANTSLLFEVDNSSSNYEYPYTNATSVQFNFRTVQNTLFRTIEKGRTYKIIYVYESDIIFHRIDPPSDAYYDGYIILDIVPVDEKFEREKDEVVLISPHSLENPH